MNGVRADLPAAFTECASAQTRPVHRINVHGGDWHDSIAFGSRLARRARKPGSDGINLRRARTDGESRCNSA